MGIHDLNRLRQWADRGDRSVSTPMRVLWHRIRVIRRPNIPRSEGDGVEKGRPFRPLPAPPPALCLQVGIPPRGRALRRRHARPLRSNSSLPRSFEPGGARARDACSRAPLVRQLHPLLTRSSVTRTRAVASWTCSRTNGGSLAGSIRGRVAVPGTAGGARTDTSPWVSGFSLESGRMLELPAGAM